MASIAERVHTRQEEIDRIESRIVELPDEAIVEITLSDGSVLKGVVTTRPTLQTFRDPQGKEGINSLLRLDDLERPERSHQVWLDCITRIVPLGSD